MTVHAVAHAKLTLTLRVLGTRPDGFHELDALVVSVSAPADVVSVERASTSSCAVIGPFSRGVPADGRNLAVRALEQLVPRDVGIALRVRKEIPAGAGLGGGSADAAATLVAVRALLGLAVDDDHLRTLAADLGSDVPFCVEGGVAWMRGRGERIETLAVVDPFPVLIAVPPFGCSTPAVYRAWDALGGPTSPRVLPAPPSVAHLVDGLVNDLEPAAEAVEPRLAGFRAAVEAAAGRPALLAGSGSAVAVCFEHAAEAARAAKAVAAAIPDGLVTVGEAMVAGTVPTTE